MCDKFLGSLPSLRASSGHIATEFLSETVRQRNACPVEHHLGERGKGLSSFQEGSGYVLRPVV